MVVIVVMMVVVMLMFIVFMLMLIVFMFVIIFVVMMVLMMMFLFVVMMMILFLLLFAVSFRLYLLNPAGRCSYSLPIELVGVDDEVEIYISIVALKDFRLWLDGTDNLFQVLQLLWFNFCSLVQEDDVAELRKNNPQLEKEWDEEYGDRMIKLVFIGQHIKEQKDAIIAELDKCLAL